MHNLHKEGRLGQLEVDRRILGDCTLGTTRIHPDQCVATQPRSEPTLSAVGDVAPAPSLVLAKHQHETVFQLAFGLIQQVHAIISNLPLET
jgi:hypothetical protein